MNVGKTITPRYTVTLKAPGFYMTPAAWHVRTSRYVRHADGKPTDANLASYVASFEASTGKGGVNAHLRPTTVEAAYITDQRTGTTVATYKADPLVDRSGGARRTLIVDALSLRGRLRPDLARDLIPKHARDVRVEHRYSDDRFHWVRLNGHTEATILKGWAKEG